MGNAETLTEKQTTGLSWFHSTFETVAGGFGLFDFFKENKAENERLDAGRKRTEVDYLLRGAFIDNEISNGEDLQKAVEAAVTAANEQGELYYGITANDVLARYAVLSDEFKEILQAAHASNDWEATQTAWSRQENAEIQEKYVSSGEFEEDKQSQIDHLLNNRMGSDLGALSGDEQAKLIQWHLETCGMDESHNITVEDVLTEYAKSGQRKFEHSTLDT